MAPILFGFGAIFDLAVGAGGEVWFRFEGYRLVSWQGPIVCNMFLACEGLERLG